MFWLSSPGVPEFGVVVAMCVAHIYHSYRMLQTGVVGVLEASAAVGLASALQC